MKRLLGLLFILSCFAGCKKSGDDKNKLAVLTAQSWKPSLFDNNTTTNPPGTHIYQAYLNCEQDDTYHFATNGKLNIDRGAMLCNQSNGIEEGDYSIDINHKKIIINGYSFTLAELSSSQLKFYAPIPLVTGYEYLIFIFKH